MNNHDKTAVFTIEKNGTIKDNGKSILSEDSEVKNNQPKDKEEWGNQIQFLMSCIAMSVGLGNIWRFPFTAYQNGGGAFLIPYLIVLVLVGRPMYYLEMCLGQFTSKGNAKMFEAMAPALKGIGYGQIMGSVCIATYYCCLLALTVFYFINSFTSNLPWSYCRQEWVEQNLKDNITCIASNSNKTTFKNAVSSSELYFRREVLKEKSQIDDGLGPPEWRLTLCLLFVWCCIFLVTRKGIKSSGKASYFLALFPYVIILTLLIRAATLEGAANGMLYFVKPDWEKLMEAQVWYAAATQCFFSLNVGLGTITMYASYNNFNHGIYRDCVVVTILDTFTSLAAGTTIFGILGSLAYKLDVDVSAVVNSGGTGLAFISYPEAIARFDVVPWLFALLFFLMLFTVGLGSLVAMQGCVYRIIMENFPHFKRWKVSLTICIAGFLIGLVYITPGGQFILTLVDHFGGTFLSFLSNIFLVTLAAWFYGLSNLCDNVQYMLKQKVGIYWRMSWGIITPIVLLAIFIYFAVNMETLKHEGTEFPTVALVFGWMIIGVAFLQAFLWWVSIMYTNRDLGRREAFRESFTTKYFGPNNEEIRQEWILYKKDMIFERKGVGRFQYYWHLLTGYKKRET